VALSNVAICSQKFMVKADVVFWSLQFRFIAMRLAVAAVTLLGALFSAVPAWAGHFEGSLAMAPTGDGRHWRTLSTYSFVDDNGRTWSAPKGTVTDGASIPQWAWSFGLGPFEGKYINAAVLHDWYCDHRERRWQDVDLMFYHAMIASGVNKLQAQGMYVAVLVGGPRWDIQTIENERLAQLTDVYVIGPAHGFHAAGEAEVPKSIVAIPLNYVAPSQVDADRAIDTAKSHNMSDRDLQELGERVAP
jgi:hypothetical protein